MKKGLLLSMLILFIGVSMQAQSIAKEQMDEQFNEGPSFPLGWFGEGWTVKDGKAKCKATEDSENSGFPGGGGMGFNFDLKAIMGFTDTLFVVERSVYGKNQWCAWQTLTSACRAVCCTASPTRDCLLRMARSISTVKMTSQYI